MINNSRPSLARDLVRRLVVGLFLLSIVLSALLYLSSSRRFLADFDEALSSKARALASLVQQDAAGKLEFEFADEFMQEYEANEGKEYFELWNPDGTVLEKSGSLHGHHLPRSGGTLENPEFRFGTMPGGIPVRTASMRFVPQLNDEAESALGGEDAKSTQTVTLVIGRSTAQLSRSLSTLLMALGGGAVLLPVFAAVLVGWTIRRGLLPVFDLAVQVEKIDSDNLQQRIQIDNAPRELEPIEQGTNRLLERLSAAFDRERRFTSNVSHELKTPIAEALAALTVANGWADDAALQAKARQDATSALRRMQRLVEALFCLARADNGLNKLQLTTLELNAVIDTCIQKLQYLAAERNVRIGTQQLQQRIAIPSEPALLETVLMNVFRNAVEYAPTDSVVSLSVQANDQHVNIKCTNQAPGLSADDANHLIEPFWRKDVSRTDGDQHNGLGLSIADSVARAICGALRVSLEDSGELLVEVILPIREYDPDRLLANTNSTTDARTEYTSSTRRS